MNTIIKFPRSLYAAILADLRRPHPTAWERVGFLTANTGTCDSNTLLLFAVQYHPVPDSQYLEDPTSGACIDSTAIRTTIQRALEQQTSTFHVHLHDHPGTTWFSTIDLLDNPRIVASCRAAAPSKPHGMLVFSRDQLAGIVWQLGEPEPTRITRCTIVGYPTKVIRL